MRIAKIAMENIRHPFPMVHILEGYMIQNKDGQVGVITEANEDFVYAKPLTEENILPKLDKEESEFFEKIRTKYDARLSLVADVILNTDTEFCLIGSSYDG